MVLLILASVLYPPDGFARKPGEVSLNQERRAGFRAIAAMAPDAAVRNPDHLAASFLPAEFWFFGLLIKDYPRTKAFIDAHRIGAYYTANAMTWHIDGILRNMAETGAEQVVLIGAGFDSRPYRFGAQMPAVRFFELDQPATQVRKRKRVEALFGTLPARVAYVPFDYRSRPFFEALVRAGYSEHRRTLFIWGGTSVLTDPAVVEDALRAIAGRSAPGSELVMGYTVAAVVAGDFSRYPGARYEAVESEVKGEPWRFGIAAGRTAGFVLRHGLQLLSDLGADELAGRYLVKAEGHLDGMPSPHHRVLHTQVVRHPEPRDGP